MTMPDSKNRRRRSAGAIAAVCGGAAAVASSLSVLVSGPHGADTGMMAMLLRPALIAVAVVLIVGAVVVLAGMAGRGRS